MAPMMLRSVSVVFASLLWHFAVCRAGVELISTNAPHRNWLATGFSGGGQISGHGRFILFQSTAPDITSTVTGGGIVNLFLLDRVSGSVSLVSPSVNGDGGAEAACVNPSMSADGRFIVFQSAAANLVTNETDSVSDIFLRDRVAGTTVQVSARYREVPGGHRASSNPVISADGEKIVFQSQSADLTGSWPMSRIPLFFLYNRSGGTNRTYLSIDLGAGAPTN